MATKEAIHFEISVIPKDFGKKVICSQSPVHCVVSLVHHDQLYCSEITNHMVNRHNMKCMPCKMYVPIDLPSCRLALWPEETEIKITGSGEVRTRADLRPLGFTFLKSNALDQLGHATDHPNFEL